MEKLIQVPYHLPRLSATEIETYMGLLLCQTELSDVYAALCLRRANRNVSAIATARLAAGIKKDLPDTIEVALQALLAGGDVESCHASVGSHRRSHVDPLHEEFPVRSK